jgi:predicted transposase YbfD/YdcC
MKDPRIDRCKLHLLEDIVFISIAAVLSGAETWNDMELYGKQKKQWLSSILSLPNGIPKHDTFNRFFSALDPAEFETCFINWVRSISKQTKGEVVSIDGKTMRGSRNQGCKTATHIVSAWASENEAILGQIKVDQKSNEITAIPKLLDALLLQGCIVTIDAMGCQKAIAKKIIKKDADYILAVKDNQKELNQNIKDSFRFLNSIETVQTTDCDHGRIETRKCSVISDLSMIENKEKWEAIRTIVKIDSERFFKTTGKVEKETRLYISSLKPDSEKIGISIREHWGIENKVHWILDVAFNEDKSRKRNGASAQNYSVLNRIALNLLKKDDTKIGIKGKRLKAGWNNDFVMQLINL